MVMKVGELTGLDMLALHLQDEDKHVRDLALSTTVNRGLDVGTLISKYERRKAQGFPREMPAPRRGRKRVFRRKL